MNWFDMLSGLALLHAVMATVAVISGMLSRRERFKQLALGLLTAVCIMQTGVVLAALARYGLEALPRAVYVNGLAWLLAVCSLFVWRSRRLAGLALMLAPITLAVMLTALPLGEQAIPPRAAGSLFTLHVLCVLAALACMAVACGAGVLFLFQERAIKSKEPLTGFRKDLPALSGLDAIGGWCVLCGFPLYSLGILFGLVSARMTWGRLYSGDTKELVSIVVWLVYAFLFHQRLARGWRGRKPAALAIAVFGAAAFSLFVVNAFMITHHSFLSR